MWTAPVLDVCHEPAPVEQVPLKLQRSSFFTRFGFGRFFSAFDTHHFITHQHSSTLHHQKSDVHHWIIIVHPPKNNENSHGTQPPWPQRTALLPVLRSRSDPQLAAALLAAARIELLPTARPKFGIWTMNHGFNGWRALLCFICNFDCYWLQMIVVTCSEITVRVCPDMWKGAQFTAIWMGKEIINHINHGCLGLYNVISCWTNNLNGKEKLRTQCLSAILECGHPTKNHWLWTRSDMTEYGTFYAATAIWSWNLAQSTEWTIHCPECTRVGRCWSPWIKDFLCQRLESLEVMGSLCQVAISLG